MMGNRGILHDDDKKVVRNWVGKSWVACLPSFNGIDRRPLFWPGRYSELFFLDEAAAFAAGHRPCAYCQRNRFNEFKNFWKLANSVSGSDAGFDVTRVDTVLHEDRAIKGDDGRARLYADIAHPINSDCREGIQRQVIIAYGEELERSKLPGYYSSYDDFGEDNYARLSDECDEDHGRPVILPVSESIHRRDVASHHQSVPHHASSQLAIANGVVRGAWGHSNAATDDEGFGVGLV